MAILPDIPGLIAYVIVAGQPATEYAPPDDGEIPTDPDQSLARLPACHRYIESKTDASFQIRVDITSTFAFPGSSDILFDAALNQEVYMKFIFAPVTTTEDMDADNVARDVKRVQGLGTIKIAIATGRFEGYRNSLDSPESLEVAEKAMKGKELSHGASFVTVPSRPWEPNPRKAIIKNRSEIAVFYFHYRSRDALDHEMVVPRLPAPDKMIQDLTNSDEEGAKIKPDAATLVKREREDEPASKMPLKMVKLSNGREAIDLTDD